MYVMWIPTGHNVEIHCLLYEYNFVWLRLQTISHINLRKINLHCGIEYIS